MKCIICNQGGVAVFYKNYIGYSQGLQFNINRCSKCKTHFIDTKNIDTSVYDEIYSESDTVGYDRYYKYAQKIKNSKNPLKYLANQESTYYPLYKFLSKLPINTKLDILEIGSGYGYTTFGIAQSGHNIIGVDISQNAVDFATKQFGNYYMCSKVEDLKLNQKFDLIVANELFEHLADPNKFIDVLKPLLKTNGKILITTPNKNFADTVNFNAVWQSDLPPVHTFWLTEKGAELIAKNHKMNLELFDYANYIEPKENALIEYRAINREYFPTTALLHGKKSRPSIKLVIFENIKKIASLYPFRIISSWYTTKILKFNKNKVLAFYLSLK
jgi:2-polyprenyl-3-methyl-5-hydroxy-6-metoxy-1,4-benzoquinol methylase